MSRPVRWAAIASTAVAVSAYWYFATGDSPSSTARLSTGDPNPPASSRDQQTDMPAMSVEVVADVDWRSAVDPVLLELFNPPDFELRFAEYPEMRGTSRTVSALLTPRAEAGDAEAQYLLSRAADRCFRAPRTLDELEAALARAGSYPAGAFRVPPDFSPVYARIRATYEFCADSTPEETARAIDWVIAAADAGHIGAQLAYASTHFPGDERIRFPYDERETAILDERRERFLTYMER